MIAAAVIAVLIVAGVLWAAVPNFYPSHVPQPGEAPVSPENAAARDATRSQAIVTTRASVLAAVAGLGALVTIAINYRNSGLNARTLATTQNTFRVTERAHLTGRYATAVEQIGNDSIAIRLGGIYALQQLAVDTDRDSDQATAVEVLSAFVRLNLHPAEEHPTPAGTTPAGTTAARRADPLGPLDRPPSPTGPRRPQRRVAGTGLRRPPTPDTTPAIVAPPGEPEAVRAREPRADVLAAISVLAQLPIRDIPRRADFTGLDFIGVDLSHARLAHASLTGADLTDAHLRYGRLVCTFFSDADLTRADLTRALLVGVRLTNAHLTDADLTDADLSGADLTGADLTRALLTDADLTGADLRGAYLTGADLTRVDLTRALLTDADLSGADLTGTTVSEDQLGSTRGAPRLGVNGVAPAAPE